jgi:hypothetical protein
VKNEIPKDNVQKARTKSRRIRTETLYQQYIEVFESPNPRLSEGII